MRSTSHFWSKLYELSTPSHLLYGSVGSGGPEAGSGQTQGGGSNSNSTGGSTTNSNLPSHANSGTATPSSEYANPAQSPRATTAYSLTSQHQYQYAQDYSPGTSPSKYRVDSSGLNDYSPESSPFGSRAGTPIGSPTPASKILSMYSTGGTSGIAGGGDNSVDGTTDASNTNNSSFANYDNSSGTVHASAAPSGTTLRKLISRHSSRSLVMSRSQLERGRLLELCLSVLGCSAQWHLQLLANRYV